MKRKIILLLILASISVPSHAQFWKNLGNVIKDVAVGVLYGATDNMVQKSGDQTTIDNWNSIKNDIAPSYSYGSEAGTQLGHGDIKGALISGISASAEATGVSSDIVALGNAGLNNWINGDNTSAIVDIGQMVTHASGNYQFDYFFDTHREYNNINRELRNNIQSGMSNDDAYRIRNEKLANLIADATEYIQNIATERKAVVMARRSEVKNALLQRGYSNMEADYLSTCLSIEDINDNNSSWSSVDEMLDNHHISYRDSQDDNVFFDDGLANLPQSGTKDEKPVDNDETVEPLPDTKPIVTEDPLREVKEQLKQTTLSGYGLNGIELLDEQKSILDMAADILSKHEELRIRLTGNSCDIGSEYGKERVAMQRALKAKAYLISKGIDSNRVEVDSNADSASLNDNKTEKERRMNRRVSISIIEN